MDFILIVIATCLILLGSAFGLVFLRLLSWHRMITPSDEPGSVFSEARYLEFQRVLCAANQTALRSCSGWAQRMLLTDRSVPVRFCHEYMRKLSDEFNRVCKTVNSHIIASQIDRSDLTGMLMKHNFLFSVAVMITEVKLIFYGFDLGVGPTELLRSLETMRVRLRSFALMVEPALRSEPFPGVSVADTNSAQANESEAHPSEVIRRPMVIPALENYEF